MSPVAERPARTIARLGPWDGDPEPCEACGQTVEAGAPCLAVPVGGGWMPLHRRCALALSAAASGAFPDLQARGRP